MNDSFTPPVTTSNIAAGWNQTNEFVVKLTAIDYGDTELDTPSGVYRTYYTTDGTEPNFSSPYNENTTGDIEFITIFTINGQGTFTIKYFSVDNNGNVELTKTNTLLLDGVSPRSIATPNFPPDGSDDWYQTNPTITLSATDVTSGPFKIFYRWNTDIFQEYLVPFQMPSEGVHTLQFYGIDNAGNVEVTNTEYYKLDNVAPYTQDDAPSGVQKQPVTVTFYSSDDISGVENTYYTTDGSIPNTNSPSGSSVVLDTTGDYIIKYFSEDFAGNQEAVRESSVEVEVDTEAPRTYISESFPINGTNGWYKNSPTITLTAVDDSGIKFIYYKLFPTGATTTAKYTGTVDLSATVNLVTNYKIKLEVDQSGTEVEIDLRGVIPSQTTITEIINIINTEIGSTIATETNSQGGIGTGYITLTSPTAGTEVATSEIKFLQPSSNDATNEVFGLDESSYPHTFTEMVVFKTYVNPFMLPEDGLWQVNYYSIDNEDNEGEVGTKNYKLDSQNPVTSTEVNFPPDGTNGWYITSPEITLNVIDETSGLYKTFYQWDNGVIIQYNAGDIITIPSQGERILSFYSIDLAGNIESFKNETFKLDYTAPETIDNTIEFQGVIYTARASGLEAAVGEHSTFIGTVPESNTTVSVVQTDNKNVQSVSKFYNSSSGQDYHVVNILGTDRDNLNALPLIENENSTRIDSYKIQLNSVVGIGDLLRSFNDVLRIYNFTNNTTYTIDPSDSNKTTGVLKLSGENPIGLTDILQVDYAYNGPPITPTDVLDVDYTFDLSQEVDVLNTIEYTILTPTMTPRIHDHNITITLTVSDNASGGYQTFYTTDGSDPKSSLTVQQGNEVYLTENGTYTIKYYSTDVAGNEESTKTATYVIIIDKNVPTLSFSYILDPNEDGENSWFKKGFQLVSDITTDDIVTRISETSTEVVESRIFTGENDVIDFEDSGGSELTSYLKSIDIDVSNNKLDFEEVVGSELTITIPIGQYSSETLRNEIKTRLDAAGSLTYTVVFSGKKYQISANGPFSLLWQSGANVATSLVNILGFLIQDKAGSSSYLSDNDVTTSILYSWDTFTPLSDLITEIQAQMGSVGAANYTVSIVNRTTTVGYNVKITSDLSGGATVFSILWNSGTNAARSIGKTLGFDITSDDTGSAFYTADYFKIKLANYFVESTQLIINQSTQFQFTLKEIVRGASGFFDEIVIDGTIPSFGEEIKVDYKHYAGIDKVDFGLDTIFLGHSFTLYNDLDKFLGIYSNKVNYKVIFPPTPGQFFLFDGEHTIFGKSYDHNSVSGTGVPQKESTLQFIDYKLDRNTPVTTDDIQNIGWRQGPVTVILTPTDASPGSGIADTHFTLDGNTPTRLSPRIQDLPDEKIVLTQSGIYIIKYFSVDFAGNVEVVKTAAFLIKLDSTPPETLLQTSPLVPDGDSDWFVTTPTINFSVTETQSGVFKTFYKLPGEISFTEFTAPFPLLVEGSINITFYSIDNVGNQESEKVTTVKFDATSPNTTTNIPSVGWSSDPTVVFTINDVSSGGKITHFTIDGSTPTISSPSGSQVTFQSSGIYTIKYFSIDIAGNIEVVQTETLQLDLEVPTISDFSPPGGIVDETTTQISFRLKDSLSGVNISTTVFEVDGIEYSQTKNTSYFSYTGTPADYLVTIYPIQGVLNFEDIEILKVRNVSDFAGNIATVLEYNFIGPDTESPRIRELYPVPNAVDASTATNIIFYISDNQSGVDITSVSVQINDDTFAIVLNEILKVQYVGTEPVATITIQNNTLRTTINGQPDITISLVDINYDTVKKINDYLDSLPDYTSSVLDTRLQQNPSTDLLNVADLDMSVDPVLNLFIRENNLNFAFIERGLGYVIFVTPNFSFPHRVPVNVIIDAKDNTGNIMDSYSYSFIPSIVASLSIEKRNYLHRTALAWINNIHENIASNYTRSRSTNFYGHHKAVGIELSRVQEELDHLNEDLLFFTVRSPYLYQKFGYLLLTESRAGLSHSDYRRLLISIFEILFKGSLKESIEAGVSLFTGSDVNITEVVFTEGADISEQFIFTVDIFIGEGRLLGLNLQLLGEQLDELFQLVKPAHTFIIKRFVWTEQFAFQAGCEFQWLKDQFGNYVLDQWGNRIPILDGDGFQIATKNAATAICDRYKLEFENTYEEDMRTNCSELQETNRTIIQDVSSQFTGTEDSFYTYYKPLLKAGLPEVAIASDVSVTVNGIPVNIIDIDSLTGYIQIDVTPAFTDVVVITYYYNPNFVYRQITFYLNDFVVSGNEFDSNQGSILNKQNINEVHGGYETDDRLHAHICETDLTYELQQEEEEAYQIPPCNSRGYFYLNNYFADGNEFDSDRGSYFNDIDSVNRSTNCPYMMIEIQDAQEEIVESPKEESITEITIDGTSGFSAENVDGIVDENMQSITFDNYEENPRFLHSCGFILNHPEVTLNSRNDLIAPASCDDWVSFALDKYTETYDGVEETSVSGTLQIPAFTIAPYISQTSLNDPTILLNDSQSIIVL